MASSSSLRDLLLSALSAMYVPEKPETAMATPLTRMTPITALASPMLEM